jgi:alkanesulfonate monooxygenase SsuD/methylene tetrahydromethanopterin reductase-like flavin-dependent oxidoreductase (luciferase family)
LPSHHPIRVAERAAMLDQLTDGRLEFGTGRSNAYEQIGQGIDPRNTRAMWEESITMLPRTWQSDEFSWEGNFWKAPARRVLPKPYQKPHPHLYLACTQTDIYDVAAEKGIGVLSSATFATTILAEHVKRYRARVKGATPVGATVNEYWGNNVHSFCGENNKEAREVAARKSSRRRLASINMSVGDFLRSRARPSSRESSCFPETEAVLEPIVG